MTESFGPHHEKDRKYSALHSMKGRVFSGLTLCLMTAAVVITAAGVYRALGQESGFRDSLIDYIELHSEAPHVIAVPRDEG